VMSFAAGQRAGGTGGSSYSSGQPQLTALVEMADSRAPGGPQSQAVAALVEALAGELGMSRHEIAEAVEAAALCDLGMVSVPESILSRPAALTALEWELVREHPVSSAQIARRLGAGERIAQALTHHHEHFGGGGYPAGLSGEQIPRSSRLLHTAAAYVAMQRERPYRAPLAAGEALAEIQAASGPQFDPEIVAALERVHSAARDEADKSRSEV
jgi:HD-GYP domain-containing protein (c-di-GMP phosphodiesterase class II)